MKYPRPTKPKAPARGLRPSTPPDAAGPANGRLYVSRTVRLTVVREPGVLATRTCNTGEQAAAIARAHIGDEAREVMLALLLDTRLHVIAVHRVGAGDIALCLFPQRVLWCAAVAALAYGVVLAHNHPTGNPAPSREDREVTERTREAGKLVGIDVLDHIILGEDRFYSFADEAFHRYDGGAL